MCNGKSEFHALMPKGQNAYEVVRYCDALGKFSALLEEATVLLRADNGN